MCVAMGGVGEGVFSPLLQAWRRATSNARGPFFLYFAGARSSRSRWAAGRVTAYPKEQSGNLDRWRTRACSGMPNRLNNWRVNGCKSDRRGRVGSR